MNNCKECIHAEMCKWIDELDGRGCDFYDGKSCDTISRAEALDQLEQAYNIMDATDRVKAMPSVQAVCEDAISREAVSKWYCNMTCDKDYCTEPCLEHKQIMMLLPVQPSRYKGHWIDYTEDGFVECPFCEHATNWDDNTNELHYCFYCGAELCADMRESEVSE